MRTFYLAFCTYSKYCKLYLTVKKENALCRSMCSIVCLLSCCKPYHTPFNIDLITEQKRKINQVCLLSCGTYPVHLHGVQN